MRELILTGSPGFWPKESAEKESIYLGPWCFAGIENHDFWNSTQFKVASSPYRNSGDVRRARLYIDKLFDRLGSALANFMNQSFCISKSERYWKIIFADWMVHWLSGAYDRYLRISNLPVEFPDEKFYVKVLEPFHFHLPDTINSKSLLLEWKYNLHLISEIISHGKFPFLESAAVENSQYRKSLDELNRKSEKSKPGEKFSFSKKIKKNTKEMLNAKLMQYCHIKLGQVYGFTFLKKLLLLFLMLKNGIRKDDLDFKEVKLKREDIIRSNFSFAPENQFETILSEILFNHIPDSLLSWHNRKPALSGRIFIGNDIYNSAVSASFIAEICEQNGRWLSVQHGGGYGMCAEFPLGKIEYELSDGFITWGWNSEDNYKSFYYPLPSPFLTSLPKHNEKTENIIFISTMNSPYYIRFHSKLLPENQLEYLELKKSFLGGLKQKLLSNLLYRPYFDNYGVDELKFLKNYISQDNLLRGSNIINDLAGAKVVVIDHMETGFIQTISMDVPTILFWNDRLFLGNAETLTYMDMLRSVGIFHDTPESASEFLNANWENLGAWWHDPKTKAVKKKFCQKYGSTNPDWFTEWKKFMLGFSERKSV